MKRMSISVLIICAGLVSAAQAQKPACETCNPWASFHRYDMQRWNRYEKVLNVKNVGKLGLKWSYTTGINVHSSPALASGVVYVGSWAGDVYALKASTGDLLWNYLTVSASVYSSPAVANASVYVISYDSYVYALSAVTGEKLWSYHTPGGGNPRR
jgi:outer membrane protein assembly factor BamB